MSILVKHSTIGLHSGVQLLFYLKWQLLRQPPQFDIQTEVITKSIFSNKSLTSFTVFVLLKRNEITFEFSATLLSAMRPLV